ncbi:class I SAM-dependent methyltransferase [Desertibaculum subflavum]|uniref:class I SAM-dependent methyltransferase n=1 Tax=Desertibaculum subflavum TaxID=2268458 RepID=UPI0034D22618
MTAAGDLKDLERRDWAARSGAWDKWSDALAKLAERMNAPLVEAAALSPGLRVLDLASGAGEPALQIARAVGPSGRVVATDLVEDMLSGARRRAAAIQLNQVEFQAADMEALPFPDAGFDRVTCRFGIMFAPDTRRALSEAHRVLKPGGRAVYLVWSEIQRNTMFQVIDAAVRKQLGSSPLDRETSPFRFADGTLPGRMTAAGFAQVSERVIGWSPEIESGQPFWRPQLDMIFGDRLADLDAASRTALDQRVQQGFARYLKGSRYFLTAETRLIVGTKPG